MYPSLFLVLKLSKILFFLQFFANISENSKTVVAIYVYASESSCFTFLKNGVGYYAIIYSLEDISVWSWWILLNFCWVSTFLEIWFFNVSWTVNILDPYKKYYFLKELDEVFQMDRNKLL